MESLHIVLVPMVAPGHMIPMVDMAKLLTSRGIKTTIISPLQYAGPIISARNSGLDIELRLVDYPPKGCELSEYLTTPDWLQQFVKSLTLLQDPVEKLIEDIHPNAIISDSFLHWTVDTAAKLGIPRLIFYSTGNVGMCCTLQMNLKKPFKNLSSDSYSFVLPDMPHELTFVRSQVALFELQDENEDDFTKWLARIREADKRSYGVVVNSFYELEHDYADHWHSVLGRKAWQIGPLLLSEPKEKAQGGMESDVVVKDECLVWLDSKTKNNSVVYMCFGSIASFTRAQLHEIAIGLDASGQDFIWVVRTNEGEAQDWLPEGYEERIKSKGLIVRGWVPQRSILDHPALGAFVTHCGWNSVLEGVSVGVPMVTWPICADHFYGEKLVSDVLKIGVSVGNKKWMLAGSEGVTSEAIAKAVKDVMLGEEGVEMRRRAMNYKELASKALQPGGSSYNGLTDLMEVLRNYPGSKVKDASLQV